jgi:hypothetical protein
LAQGLSDVLFDFRKICGLSNSPCEPLMLTKSSGEGSNFDICVFVVGTKEWQNSVV